MNKEQNINDILKLLKDSVSTQQITAEDIGVKSSAVSSDLSEELLKKQLKDTFFDNDAHVSDENESEGDYVIDKSFLEDVIISDNAVEPKSTDVVVATDDTDEIIALDDETPPFDLDGAIIINESEDLNSPSIDDDDINAAQTEDIAALNDDVNIALEAEDDKRLEKDEEQIESEDTYNSEEADISVSIDNETVFADLDEQELSNDSALLIEAYEDNNTAINLLKDNYVEDDEKITDSEGTIDSEETIDVEAITNDEKTTYDDDIIDDDELVLAEDGTWVVLHQPELSEHSSSLVQLTDNEATKHETYIAAVRKVGLDFSTETPEQENSIINIPTADELDKIEETEKVTEDDNEERLIPADDNVDLSTINLMMQFCEKDELSDTIGDERIENILRDSVKDTEGCEDEPLDAVKKGSTYTRQKTERMDAKRNLGALIRMCGCFLIALIALIYESLPSLGISLPGLFDYITYPAVYALIGLQFVVFSAAICYQKLWQGLKRAFSFVSDMCSVITILLLVTVLYDLVIVIALAFTGDTLPPMFNAVATLMVAFIACADYSNASVKYRAYCVCSSNEEKFTLVKESGRGSIAEKMYTGGVAPEKNIYSVKPSNSHWKLDDNDFGATHSGLFITVSIVIAVAVGIAAAIVAMMLGSELYASLASLLICMYSILPISIVFSATLPYFIASKKLAKRNSAFLEYDVINEFQKCDVLVFGDLHMFKKCKTEDVGIVIYDTAVGYLTLGCLKALYSKIGGPMSALEMQLPDVFCFDDVRVKRIARNGIEAIIDRKHVLIVGEPAFMGRYGLTFPENEKNNGRATLCISLNGHVTAKLSVKYETEPVFEMLAERLYKEGISCTIQTYDPLINSVMIGDSRTIGYCPISVVHKNTDDLRNEGKTEYRTVPDALVSCSSRLKLAEMVVWLKRLAKIKNVSRMSTTVFSCVGGIALAGIIAFGAISSVSQLHILLYLLLQFAVILIIVKKSLPSKNYFTTDALYFELEKKAQSILKKEQKLQEKRQKNESQ